MHNGVIFALCRHCNRAISLNPARFWLGKPDWTGMRYWCHFHLVDDEHLPEPKPAPHNIVLGGTYTFTYHNRDGRCGVSDPVRYNADGATAHAAYVQALQRGGYDDHA